MLSNPMIGLALVFAVVASALFVAIASLTGRDSSARRDRAAKASRISSREGQ